MRVAGETSCARSRDCWRLLYRVRRVWTGTYTDTSCVFMIRLCWIQSDAWRCMRVYVCEVCECRYVWDMYEVNECGYVCEYVCVCACVNIHQTHIYTCIHTYAHLTHINKCVHTSAHAHTHIHTCTTHKHILTHTCTCTYRITKWRLSLECWRAI